MMKKCKKYKNSLDRKKKKLSIKLDKVMFSKTQSRNLTQLVLLLNNIKTMLFIVMILGVIFFSSSLSKIHRHIYKS